MSDKIKETVEFLKDRISLKPDIGIILGTGLGGLVNEIEILHTIPYTTIPNFPVSTVAVHNGQLISGKMSGKNIVAIDSFGGGFSLHDPRDERNFIFQRVNVDGGVVGRHNGDYGRGNTT